MRKILNKGCMISLLIFFIIFVFIPLTLFYVRHRMIIQELDDKKAAIRAKGHPVTLKELDNYYTAVPDDENAALIYDEAMSYIETVEDSAFNNVIYDLYIVGNADLPFLGEPLDSRIAANTKVYFDSHKSIIPLIKKATKHDKCRFNIKLQDGYDTHLPHLSKLRELIRLFYIHSILAVEKGDTKTCTKNIDFMLKVADSIKKEPLYLSLLCNVNFRKIAAKCFEHCLNKYSFDDESLQRLAVCFKQAQDSGSNALKKAMIGEQSLILNLDAKSLIEIQNFLGFNHKGIDYFIHFMDRIDLIELNQLKMLEFIEEIFKTLELTPYKAIRKLQKLENRLLTLKPKDGIAKILLPSLISAYKKKHYYEVNLELAYIACQIERYRLKYKKLPEKLSDLVPEFMPAIPIDPFSGKPLLYKIGDIEFTKTEIQEPSTSQNDTEPATVFNIFSGKGRKAPKKTTIKKFGYTVYSFGKDFDDDNGQRDQFGNRKSKDIVFQVVR